MNGITGEATILSTVMFSLLAGVSTFFSACAYPLLPGYVGFYASQTDSDEASLSGSLVRGLVAGLGVLVTLALIIGATYWIGHSTLSRVTIFEPIAGVLLIGFGLLIVFDRAPSISIPLPKRRSSILGFGIFGVGYALAAAGCVAPIFISVTSYSLTLPVGEAALLVGTYVGTVTLLMVSLTVATGVGLIAGGGRLTAHTKLLERIAGAVMIIAGLGQLYLSIFVFNVV
ncbi:cytochrome c biogenesis CcdA family protein [Natrialba asiatica]|uniref:Cytochrome c biogenesis protein transmembrane region n=1 Tax=Natrialba asiatica (strain ATCC 700177 / DSM 12278 / JCM 9576 / FERM P-10747 / NBRC 102637 / 172P1) TaxID=29540 RepID=M0AQJ3_NATA1|nr:cytochrome c biogenesis protein CcdA [Natrialba asiatica]ELZ00577.1 cytochrome c biogenesis protein transmembrane region [Natrialba asiatica DSM 12278]